MEEDRQNVSGASGGPEPEEGAAAFTLDVAAYHAELAELHLGAPSASRVRSLRWRCADDRLLLDPGSPTWGQWSEKRGRSDCMGRSRGGLTTKIHALVDAAGRPIRLKLTAGQAHDGRSAVDILASLGPGQTLLADGRYDADYLRDPLAARGAVANIKPMPNRKRLPAFDRALYRKRNAVERFFNKLKQFRAVATRYDKTDDNFLASVHLAAIRVSLREYESVT